MCYTPWLADCKKIGRTRGADDNVIRVLMPLVITDAQLEQGPAIMVDGLAALND